MIYGASSEDQTATVGAHSNEGTFIMAIWLEAREIVRIRQLDDPGEA